MAPWVGDSSYTINPQQPTATEEQRATLSLKIAARWRFPGATSGAAAVEKREAYDIARDVLGLIPRQPTPEPAPPVVPVQRQKPRRVRPGRRWCSMHAASHPVAAFGRDAANADGLASSCREARSAAQRRQRLDARRAEQ